MIRDRLQNETAQEKMAHQLAGVDYACFVDADETLYPQCVLDQNARAMCDHARGRHRRETCRFWQRQIGTAPSSIAPSRRPDTAPDRSLVIEAIQQALLTQLDTAVKAAHSLPPEHWQGTAQRWGAEMVVWSLWKELRKQGVNIEAPANMKYPP